MPAAGSSASTSATAPARVPDSTPLFRRQPPRSLGWLLPFSGQMRRGRHGVRRSDQKLTIRWFRSNAPAPITMCATRHHRDDPAPAAPHGIHCPPGAGQCPGAPWARWRDRRHPGRDHSGRAADIARSRHRRHGLGAVGPGQAVVAGPDGGFAEADPGEDDVFLARPLHECLEQGQRHLDDDDAEQAVPRQRPGQLPDARAGDGHRSGDARLPRQRAEHEILAERELRPRAPGTVHARNRALCRERCAGGGQGVDRTWDRLDRDVADVPPLQVLLGPPRHNDQDVPRQGRQLRRARHHQRDTRLQRNGEADRSQVHGRQALDVLCSSEPTVERGRCAGACLCC